MVPKTIIFKIILTPKSIFWPKIKLFDSKIFFLEYFDFLGYKLPIWSAVNPRNINTSYIDKLVLNFSSGDNIPVTMKSCFDILTNSINWQKTHIPIGVNIFRTDIKFEFEKK